MNSMPVRRIGIALAASLALAGCSSSADDRPAAGAAGASTTAATSATPYLPVPDGVELTDPGSRLAVGDHAVVAYHPRQQEVAALDVQVTGLERASIKDFSAWQLSDAQRRSTPYYVRASIKNLGETDVGGLQVPLYVVNDQDVLLESTPFTSSFEPCPSTPFPQKFGPGERAKACLVYLAPNHGDLVAVSFRPEQTFDPITWTGEVSAYQPPKAGGTKAGDKKTGERAGTGKQ
jgi:hypothetical protein